VVLGDSDMSDLLSAFYSSTGKHFRPTAKRFRLKAQGCFNPGTSMRLKSTPKGLKPKTNHYPGLTPKHVNPGLC